MQNIDTYNFSGKRVLIRVDFNVPLNDKMEVTDDTRIRMAIPTIKTVMDKGGKVILMSHLGRPNDAPDDKFSLKHVVPTLKKLLKKDVVFVSDCVGKESVETTTNMGREHVALLENLRFYKEEKAGDEFFAGQLAEHGDVYINDAFGTAHRAHASTAVIAKFFPHDKMFGKIMESEILNINRVLHGAEKPVTAIIGGAKVSSKISVLENLMSKVDNMIIGGGMAYTFVRAQGGSVGSSLVEDDRLDQALRIMQLAEENNVNFLLPSDTVIADKFSNEANTKVVHTNEIPSGWMGLDIGPGTSADIRKILRNSRTILWNGPMGVFEMSKFENGTKNVAETIASVTQAGGVFSLIGGGDSVAAINKYHLADKVSYVSTGGGAMLEYLEGIDLPGIAAIKS